MEPIVDAEGYRILQSSEEAWRFVKEYYEKLGYNVIDPASVSGHQTQEVKR
jgi:hypothetical protein